jgi:hypothetical protein
MMDPDTMSTDDLAVFWGRCTTSTGAMARKLFPSKPAGYQAVTASLALYALNLYHSRRSSDPATRAAHESLCRAIYDNLPDWAKWSVTV